MIDIVRMTYYGCDSIWEDDDGSLVWYEDHLAIVEKLKQEIEEAYERGFFNGACTGYGQG